MFFITLAKLTSGMSNHMIVGTYFWWGLQPLDVWVPLGAALS